MNPDSTQGSKAKNPLEILLVQSLAASELEVSPLLLKKLLLCYALICVYLYFLRQQILKAEQFLLLVVWFNTSG